jgi:peptide/nickel transport system ATP-binding protein
MYRGEIVEIADNRNLFYPARHAYTKALLSAVPAIEGNPCDISKLVLEGEPPSPSTSRLDAALHRAAPSS